MYECVDVCMYLSVSEECMCMYECERVLVMYNYKICMEIHQVQKRDLSLELQKKLKLVSL